MHDLIGAYWKGYGLSTYIPTEQRRGQWVMGGFWPRIYVVKKGHARGAALGSPGASTPPPGSWCWNSHLWSQLRERQRISLDLQTVPKEDPSPSKHRNCLWVQKRVWPRPFQKHPDQFEQQQECAARALCSLCSSSATCVLRTFALRKKSWA
jgi:hypothetical protein